MPRVQGTVPGVGSVNLLRPGTWIGLFLGLTAVALTYGYSQSAANKVKSTVNAMVPKYSQGTSAPSAYSGPRAAG